MAQILTIVAHILTLLIIVSVARAVYKGGGGALLTAFVTVFLLIFGTVSAVESGVAAQGSGVTKLTLLLFVIAEAVLLPIAFSAS